jgi:hypothetical protein
LLFLFAFVASNEAFLGLGTLSSFTSIACPSGFYVGAVCKSFTVSCTGVADMVVNVGVITPGTWQSTMIVQNGGGGTSVFDNGYVAKYLAANVKVVQLKYIDSQGWTSSGTGFAQNLTLCQCRPSTVNRGIFTNIHGGSLTKAFGVHGHSGGCNAAMGSMVWYGADSYVDYIACSAGPNFSNTTTSCAVPNAGLVTVCPNNGQTYCPQTSENFQCSPIFPHCSQANNVQYSCNCTTSTGTEIAAWNSQSLLNGFSLSFSHTKITAWVCSAATSGSVNDDPAQAELFSRAASATNGYKLYVIQNCPGSEDVWNGSYQPTGQNGLIFSSGINIGGLVPRH